MQRLVFAVVLLTGCVRKLDQLPVVETPLAATVPTLVVDRTVVSAGREYSARVQAPVAGERYIWTAVNAYIDDEHSLGTETRFVPAGIGVMVLIVEAETDATRRERATVTLEVIPPPPEDLVLDAPTVVTAFREGLDLSVSTNSEEKSLTYEWMLDGVPLGYSGPHAFADVGDAGVATISVRAKNAAGDTSLVPAERVMAVVPKQTVLLAGGIGGQGNADGVRDDARMYSPTWLAPDASGGMYVLDLETRTLGHVTHDGMLSTLAGARDSDAIYRQPIDPPFPAAEARFSQPFGLVRRTATELAIFEHIEHPGDGLFRCQVQTYNETTGVLSTFIETDCTCGTGFSQYLTAMTSDGAGNIYIADGNAITHIDPTGVISLYAGSCDEGASSPGFDGARLDARFSVVDSLVLDGDDLVALETNTYYETLETRRIPPTGVVSTRYLSIPPLLCTPDPDDPYWEASDLCPLPDVGDPYDIRSYATSPKGLALQEDGTLLIMMASVLVRQPSAPAAPVAVIGTLDAGDSANNADGVGTAASIESGVGMQRATDGSLWFAAENYGLVRRISGDDLRVETLIGRDTYDAPRVEETVAGIGGFVRQPRGLVAAGTDDELLVIIERDDISSDRAVVYRMLPTGTDTYSIAPAYGSLIMGNASRPISDGDHLSRTRLNTTTQFQPDGDGFLVIDNLTLYRIERFGYPTPYEQLEPTERVYEALRMPDGGIALLTSSGSEQRLSVVLGDSFNFILKESTYLAFGGLAHDGDRTLFYTEQRTHAIYAIDLLTSETTLVAGKETPGVPLNDKTPCAEASFLLPTLVRHAPNGDLFVVDGGSIHRVRRSPQCLVDTLTVKDLGLGVQLTHPARLNNITGITFTRARDLVVSDYNENSVILLRY